MLQSTNLSHFGLKMATFKVDLGEPGMLEEGWGPAPQLSRLLPGEVHVWCASLAAPGLQRLGALLSMDERDRAVRFRFDTDRHRFVARRGLLRAILGRYLGLDPGSLCFTYGMNGKPDLHGLPLQFNASTSAGRAVYAVCLDRCVGIDLEQNRSMPDLEQIVRSFFFAAEREAFLALEPGLRRDAFFRCWTRKEALMKAHGDGVSVALNRWEVSLLPGEPATLRHVDGCIQAAGNWRLFDVSAGSGYVSALAVEHSRKE